MMVPKVNKLNVYSLVSNWVGGARAASAVRPSLQ